MHVVGVGHVPVAVDSHARRARFTGEVRHLVVVEQALVRVRVRVVVGWGVRCSSDWHGYVVRLHCKGCWVVVVMVYMGPGGLGGGAVDMVHVVAGTWNQKQHINIDIRSWI